MGFPNPPLIVGDPPADGDTAVFDAASGTWKAGHSGTSVPTPTTGDAGKVVTVNGAEDGYELDTPSGGGGAGSAVVRKFVFTHATAGLLTGAAVYTPTIGDVLLDGWVEITTAFDGTTPTLDFGPFLAGDSHMGYFNTFGYGALDVSAADQLITEGLSIQAPGHQPNSDLMGNTLNSPAPNGGQRVLPARFVTADPIKVVVSQNGSNNGANPGSTAGGGVLYLVTATPA